MRRTRGALAALVLAAPLLVVTACAGSPTTTTPTELPPPTAIPTSPGPTPSSATTAPIGAPACETIIPEETVADFEDIGWSAKADVFRAGSVELEGGVHCTWGDYSVATDHVQIFGWAPTDDAQATDAIDELVGSGWVREDDADGVYVTENPEWVIAPDENGYGFTYLFGDGWVKVADTKQSLLLVEWPPR